MIERAGKLLQCRCISFLLAVLSCGSLLFTGDEVRSQTWAFEETFNGRTPGAPSQDMLPRTFDYSATHRTHPATTDGRNAEGSYGSFMADHGDDCSPPSNQHRVAGTTHRSNMAAPDASFFVCRDHMMSSMGDVDGYSVSAFWPRQEFDFAGGGVLEFDVNINEGHGRSWWEILITPRSQMQVGAAKDWLPIDETYPPSRIVLTFAQNSSRQIEVGARLSPPAGVIASRSDWAGWEIRNPGDPATTDRAIRRKMRVEFESNRILWSVQKSDGSFDTLALNVPNGLPFGRGLVLFKTHAYTPTKDGNRNIYTFHWDNIRFSGPKLTPYDVFEYGAVVNLQGNGSRAIGSTVTHALDLPPVGPNPVLFGQTNGGMTGQVLVSINGRPDIAIAPHSRKGSTDDCWFGGWRSFRVSLDPSLLKTGENTFKWTIGPRPACAEGQWWWDGFSVKGLEVQVDGVRGAADLLGDLNRDGSVNAADLVILENYLASNLVARVTPFLADLSGADLNVSGTVDAVDLVIMRNFLAGNILTLP